MKTKIKSSGDEITDFYDSLDSFLKKDDNYPQMSLKECKYIEKKLIRHINDNLCDFSSSDESDEE